MSKENKKQFNIKELELIYTSVDDMIGEGGTMMSNETIKQLELILKKTLLQIKELKKNKKSNFILF